MGSNRIEVSQQKDPPFLFCFLNVPRNFFNEKLGSSIGVHHVVGSSSTQQSFHASHIRWQRMRKPSSYNHAQP
uniref:UDP-galactose-4 epimerase n=1 Tax=Cyamopsis tetragonoloba TaxID=3832 RepID=A0A678PZT5_CYATE|nr:UDP-galactose-4 epimerase [Cyamopsis tetragonoloba]